MRDEIAIRIENLGKRYRLGNVVDLSRTFRETLMDLPRFFRKKTAKAAASAAARAKSLVASGGGEDAGPGGNDPETPPGTFWALRDINLEIKRGEVLGIIGPNGAGKSTLLKILSRITTPTEGQIELHGRVGALLEVGTGFHPELTGRENIYLNGAILGMRKTEVDRKYDEIVAFAGVEQFLDTPVKRYSSGMRVRLGFAVAAHLDPEILIVDEVLSVGDAKFRKKCLGKMRDVATGGRTVLFVSHNMSAVQNLCTSAILLDKGRITYAGEVQETQNIYLQKREEEQSLPISDRIDRSGTGAFRMTSLEVLDAKTNIRGSVRCGNRLRIKICYEGASPLRNPRVLIGFYDLMNSSVFRIDTDKTKDLPNELPAQGTLICETGPVNIPEKRLNLNLALFGDHNMADYVVDACHLDVESTDFYGTGQIFESHETLYLLEQRWEVAG